MPHVCDTHMRGCASLYQGINSGFTSYLSSINNVFFWSHKVPSFSKGVRKLTFKRL